VAVAAETVRQLRERTSAGMMECKNALVATNGDLDAAAELLRKQGTIKADKKGARIAAEGVIAIERAADGKSAVMVEVNSETDFVARGDEFGAFAAAVAKVALERRPADVEALLGLPLPAGGTVDAQRREMVARIGENISVRRFVRVDAAGTLAHYLHGTRIGTLVALEGGDANLARDLAMHVAASNPRYNTSADIPADIVAKERSFLTEQAAGENKPAEIIAKMVEGRLRKSLGELTLAGQAFVKDPDTSVEKLLKGANAKVTRFERLEVGAGIEKKQDDFVAEVRAQALASANKPAGNGATS
jgi:elongation factor Ts